MTDAEFLDALESCQLAAPQFGHAGHVRAGFLYLQRFDFPTALGRIRQAIRGYAAHLGKPERYHETMTVAYLALIQQHIAERGADAGWAGFERSNPELLQRDLLLRFYTKAELESPLARRIFLLPRPASSRLFVDRSAICAFSR